MTKSFASARPYTVCMVQVQMLESFFLDQLCHDQIFFIDLPAEEGYHLHILRGNPREEGAGRVQPQSLVDDCCCVRKLWQTVVP